MPRWRAKGDDVGHGKEVVLVLPSSATSVELVVRPATCTAWRRARLSQRCAGSRLEGQLRRRCSAGDRPGRHDLAGVFIAQLVEAEAANARPRPGSAPATRGRSARPAAADGRGRWLRAGSRSRPRDRRRRVAVMHVVQAACASAWCSSTCGAATRGKRGLFGQPLQALHPAGVVELQGQVDADPGAATEMCVSSQRPMPSNSASLRAAAGQGDGQQAVEQGGADVRARPAV